MEAGLNVAVETESRGQTGDRFGVHTMESGDGLAVRNGE